MTRVPFKDKYLEHYQIEAAKFPAHLLARCLYPHARLVAWVFRRIEPHMFAADYDLIHEAGTLGRIRGFRDVVQQWSHHPRNRGPVRMILNVRISIKRLRKEVEFIMAGPAGG